MDIPAIAKAKLVFSFPGSQFILEEPIRLDVNSREGRLLVAINNDIPFKYLRSFHLPGDIQAFPLEIKLKQRKLLVLSIYQPPDQNLYYFLSSIKGLLDHYLKSYKDFFVMSAFYANESNPTQI